MDKHSKRSASIFRYPVLMAFTLFLPGCSCWTLSRRTGPTVNWKHHPLPAAQPVRRLG